MARELLTDSGSVGQLGPETPESFARSRLAELWDDEPLLVFNDEGHHAYRPAAVSEGEARSVHRAL